MVTPILTPHPQAGGGEDGSESGANGGGSEHWELEYLVQYIHGDHEVLANLGPTNT